MLATSGKLEKRDNYTLGLAKIAHNLTPLTIRIIFSVVSKILQSRHVHQGDLREKTLWNFALVTAYDGHFVQPCV